MCGIMRSMSDQALTALLLCGTEPLSLALRDANWRVTDSHTLAGAGRHDAVLICVDQAGELAERPGLTDAAFESAVVVQVRNANEPAELALLAEFDRRAPSIRAAVAAADYAKAMAEAAAFRAPVHRFFTEVFVMVDDLPLRHSRLMLLVHLRDLILEIADISQLAPAAA